MESIVRLFQSKKGLWEGGRSWVSLLVGFVLLVLGIIPLLNGWGVISFALPSFLTSLIAIAALYIISAGGFYLLIDGFLEWGNPMAWLTFVVALIVLAIGTIPLLNQYGAVTFTVPFLNLTVYYIIFTVEGFFLFIGAFLME